MGFAANTIMDVVAPPPPARGSNASADDASAPSFQDHVDASDQRSQRSDPPRAQRETHISSDRSSSPPPSDQASAAHPDTSRDDTKQETDAPAAAINPPVLVQLITDTMPAMLGAKAEQPAAAQQEAASTDQTANAGAIPAAALAATTVAPTKIAPKPEAAPRMAQVKTAKGATAKTSSATDDANTAAAQTPAPTTQESTAEPATTPSLTAVVANSGAKSEESPNVDGVEAVTSGPTRSAQQSSQHGPPASAPAAPQLEATPQQPDAAQTQTKARDGAKASAPLDALKQAVQDLAPAAPKAQPAPSVALPAATHAQLAEPVQRAASDTTAARVAPAAAQVGGEIIRRFNGHDTSFQLRLDPPELGRVDVRLDVSRDHRVTAVISADSPQALSDLTRGARDLQQALQSAGLDLADDGLRFDLSSNGQGHSFAQTQAQQDQADVRAANAASPETPIAPEVTVSRPLSIDSWRGSRVDLVA